MLLPDSIQSLVTALERLPGIGPKSASRLAFFLLRASEDVAQDLATALANLKANTALCQECFNIMEAGRAAGAGFRHCHFPLPAHRATEPRRLFRGDIRLRINL